MRLKVRYLFYFTLLFYSCVSGQKKPSRNYTTADGLPNNSVRSQFLDRNSDLWIGTENGISKMENGSFTNLPLPETIANRSCWDISQDENGSMWFASYGGGVYKFDGKNFTYFNKKNGLPMDRVRKLLSHNGKMYIGTELGVAIIDIKTNRIVSLKGIKPHFGVFIVTDFFVYENQIYFSTSNEGLFKISTSNNTTTIEHVLNYQNVLSLGFYNNILFSGNKGFLNCFTIEDVISQKIKTQTFGKTTVWDFTNDNKNTIYAAAWGIFDSSGGLYRVKTTELQNISDEYGIDSKNLLSVVFNNKKNILYVGSKDKGIYEIQLDETIDYNPFNDKAIVDFETLDSQKIILHQDGISFLDAKNSISKTISVFDFKKFEVAYINNSKQKLPRHADGFYELNYNITAQEIEFYEILNNHSKSLHKSYTVCDGKLPYT